MRVAQQRLQRVANLLGEQSFVGERRNMKYQVRRFRGNRGGRVLQQWQRLGDRLLLGFLLAFLRRSSDGEHDGNGGTKSKNSRAPDGQSRIVSSPAARGLICSTARRTAPARCA